MTVAMCCVPVWGVGAVGEEVSGEADAFEELGTDALELTIVQAGFESTLVSELPHMVRVVGKEELGDYGAASVSEGLDHVAGVTIENDSGKVRVPSIRGARAKHSLVLWNGRRMAAGFRSLVDLNQQFLGGLERVEILKGPVSPVYGSDAIGGVVNLVPRRAAEVGWFGDAQIQLRFGEWDEEVANVTGGGWERWRAPGTGERGIGKRGTVIRVRLMMWIP